MREYTEEERKLISGYLFEWGKEKISQAGIQTIDLIAFLFINELKTIDETKAQKLYDFYDKNA